MKTLPTLLYSPTIIFGKVPFWVVVFAPVKYWPPHNELETIIIQHSACEDTTSPPAHDMPDTPPQHDDHWPAAALQSSTTWCFWHQFCALENKGPKCSFPCTHSIHPGHRKDVFPYFSWLPPSSFAFPFVCGRWRSKQNGSQGKGFFLFIFPKRFLSRRK